STEHFLAQVERDELEYIAQRVAPPIQLPVETPSDLGRRNQGKERASMDFLPRIGRQAIQLHEEAVHRTRLIFEIVYSSDDFVVVRFRVESKSNCINPGTR
ncbi:unnamed protein product, partial [Linum tenue]